jgi:S-adenosylmethionine:diacylglycerol 3-amino-3-carboxypropyl transferase
MRKVMPDLIKVIGHEFNVYCKMEKELTEKVSFDFIRYANCWEDADILLAGLAPPSGAKILSIGSAGDNSFSLLCCRPSLVVAVDVNRTQLHLIELKKACIHLLAYEEILAFLGFHPSTQRKLIFTKIKKELSSSCAAYWEANLDQIESGIISQGKFEKFCLGFILLKRFNSSSQKRMRSPKSFFMINIGILGDGNFSLKFSLADSSWASMAGIRSFCAK